MTDTNVSEKECKETSIKNQIKVIHNIKQKVRISEYMYLLIKRLFDIFVGLIGIFILVPLTIFVAIFRKVKNEDDGPIFYTHLRIGKNGKQFKLYKYRTMCMNADEKLKKYRR